MDVQTTASKPIENASVISDRRWRAALQAGEAAAQEARHNAPPAGTRRTLDEMTINTVFAKDPTQEDD